MKTFDAYWSEVERLFGPIGQYGPPPKEIARQAFRLGLHHSYERDRDTGRPLRERPALNPPVTNPVLMQALETFARPRPIADGPIAFRWRVRGGRDIHVSVEQACEMARDRIEDLERVVGVLMASQKGSVDL